MANEEICHRLAKAGLWEEVEGGFQFHDWHDFQPDGQEVRARRAETSEKRRIAGKKGAQARWAPPEEDGKTDDLPSDLPQQLPWQTDGKKMPPNPNPSTSKEVEVPTARDDVEQLCTRLRDRIIANGSKAPSITRAWKDEARRLLDRDGRELQKALNLVDWCQQDSFWRSNIQSMPTFRKKYDQLRLRALEDWEKGKGPINPDAPEEIDADKVLGKDYWQCPPSPEGLSVQEDMAWKREQRALHEAERIKEARQELDERSRAAS